MTSFTERMGSALFEPSLTVIALSILVALSVPLLLHLLIYRTSAKTTLPTFLLVGPRGSGKTTLLTLFERGSAVPTRTSQTPLSAEISLPVTTKAASSKYRSVNDPSLQVHKPFLLLDTPGHGKLRFHAFENVTKPQNLKGIIFVVDAAHISTDQGLREAAEYLHDILLLLQKRASKAGGARSSTAIPVLIAANKQDLFTALPTISVKKSLETEISNVRTSKSKGLLDSGIGMGEGEMGDERDWLGDGGDGPFTFGQMEDVDITVTVAGGNLIGPDGKSVQKWWDWIGEGL